MFGNLFRYENDMLFKKRKGGNKWTCCNDLKPPNPGYIQVKVNGNMMRVHRLFYHFHNPEWNILDTCQDNSIDHINGNKMDNRIKNLRVVNSSQNKQNVTHYGGKPVRGVCFCKTYNSWKAVWQENRKAKSKYFNTESEALDYRAKMVYLHYTHHPSKR